MKMKTKTIHHLDTDCEIMFTEVQYYLQKYWLHRIVMVFADGSQTNYYNLPKIFTTKKDAKNDTEDFRKKTLREVKRDRLNKKQQTYDGEFIKKLFKSANVPIASQDETQEDKKKGEMYRFILSFDIQNENGESVLSNKIANCSSVEVTKEQVKDFSYPTTHDRLDRFLVHFLATAFRGREVDGQGICLPPEGVTYNFELSYPKVWQIPERLRTNIAVDRSIESGRLQANLWTPHLGENF